MVRRHIKLYVAIFIGLLITYALVTAYRVWLLGYGSLFDPDYQNTTRLFLELSPIASLVLMTPSLFREMIAKLRKRLRSE